MSKSPSKVERILKSLPKERIDQIGIEVDHLMKTDLKFIVNHYLMAYRTTAKDVFGYDLDDLRQEIMMILIGALATYQEDKGVKITSYLSVCLKNYMKNFTKKSGRKKYFLTKLYFPEKFQGMDVGQEVSEEDWADFGSRFKNVYDFLSETERKFLYHHLIEGEGINDIKDSLGLTTNEVVKIIREIEVKMGVYDGD